MQPTGLTFDEFVDLKVRPRAGADRAFQEAAAMEVEGMFPMTLLAASSHLRSRGYDCRPEVLEMLYRDELMSWAAVRAHGALCELATDLPYASAAEREALQAGIEFERWLLENCQAVWESRAP